MNCFSKENWKYFFLLKAIFDERLIFYKPEQLIWLMVLKTISVKNFSLGLILGTQCLIIAQAFTMPGCEVQFKDFTYCCGDVVGGE